MSINNIPSDSNFEGLKLPELPDTFPFADVNVKVIFVLGGPGVGKGTQCKLASEEFGHVHLSAGELLREELKREGSPYAEIIQHVMTHGLITPQRITISLLMNAMKSHVKSEKRDQYCFLIDGFPRDISQGVEFENRICPMNGVLFYDCNEDVMIQRLEHRGLSSGRSDDNSATILKRLQTFNISTMPVRQYYQDLGKLAAVDCKGSIAEVYEATKAALNSFL